MDYADILTAVGLAGTGLGGYVGGRITGRSGATQIASATVDMLQTQVNLLKEDKERRELEILDLLQRVAVLEGLVTQRAEVEEVINNVTQIRDTVDRIEAKVGTCERRAIGA